MASWTTKYESTIASLECIIDRYCPASTALSIRVILKHYKDTCTSGHSYMLSIMSFVTSLKCASSHPDLLDALSNILKALTYLQSTSVVPGRACILAENKTDMFKAVSELQKSVTSAHESYGADTAMCRSLAIIQKSVADMKLKLTPDELEVDPTSVPVHHISVPDEFMSAQDQPASTPSQSTCTLAQSPSFLSEFTSVREQPTSASHREEDGLKFIRHTPGRAGEYGLDDHTYTFSGKTVVFSSRVILRHPSGNLLGKEFLSKPELKDICVLTCDNERSTYRATIGYTSYTFSMKMQ